MERIRKKLVELKNTRQSCLVPDLRRYGFRSSPLKIMLAVILVYMVFIMLRLVLSMPIFWRVFFFFFFLIMNGC